MVDTYIDNLRVYQRIREGGVAFKLEISNNGTAKATDIKVFIDFPEEFMLFNTSDIEDIPKPKAPKLPQNPIKIAEEEYINRINPLPAAISKFGRIFSQINISPNIEALGVGLADSYFRAKNESLSVNEHDIVAEAQQIPHRDLRVFDDIYVVPTARGKFKVKVSLMCSEYLEPVESYIDVEVI